MNCTTCRKPHEGPNKNCEQCLAVKRAHRRRYYGSVPHSGPHAKTASGYRAWAHVNRAAWDSFGREQSDEGTPNDHRARLPVVSADEFFGRARA